ncbi:helix-turn-helix domain-containing protein [Verminephrobacter aporrectodeae]|uniref:Helix-turn-helix domain-containing protein n=1 Tax=Verminephrobacter aporrectodeae subsp. tuberculatae TaxID=1110392 RepID=A0ABT3KQC6_9BURK|nr:helix-turn-helix domain-containing protein [Verminephrobacter aporrectodeae]MCW5320517.1 helix-turn-helix domain-containing protein [Verminephrobacter aporrectodeae subsp. tuberculatae]MCW8176011.1 helix-turn-helix domain-containing protein [Verminephrobacter aporrectodeae subsp. tuberculatae]MCW8203708.1 helix-turn-helix domain-containing protein [Verminephrobacter aporrectodeae subsp. tuberculatae]
MSESEAVASEVTAGGLLREARQAAGVHIAALALTLKVPASKLEALEADEHAALPDMVFARALASSVCRMLKVDPAPVLARLPQSRNPPMSANRAGLNAPVKGGAGKFPAFSYTAPQIASRLVMLLVLLLLGGASLLFFIPRLQQGGAVVPVPDLSPPDSVGDASITALPAEGALAQGDLVPDSVPVAADATPAAVPASGAASPASAPAALAESLGVLVLHARSLSWVRVRDATGAFALQRNLLAGESVSVAAPIPLDVVIGRADAMDVTVRGKPFDLAPVSRENVARFEVK